MVKHSMALLKRAYKNNSKLVRANFLIALVLEILAVLLLYRLNTTYGSLYEGIQVYDTVKIWYSIAMFTFLAMCMVVVNGYMGFFINRLAFEIRKGLTEFELVRTGIVAVPNYGQRVQEDLKRFADSACDITFALIKAGLHLPVFIAVIISITQWYIGVAIVAAVVGGTVLTRLVARRLVSAQNIQESNEAQFRRTLDANYSPELQFNEIKLQFKILNNLFKRLSFTQSGLGQAFVLLPFIVLMPFYLSKSITLGAFFQSVNALGKVIDSLSVLIDNRQILTQIETCTVRLEPLLKD